jgi:hypothetical protein
MLLASLFAGCAPGGGPSDGGADVDVGPIDAGPPDAGPPDLSYVDFGSDFGYGCHWDCFGRNYCVDGVAHAVAHAPVDCDRWTGMCPEFGTYACARGCRTDVEYTSHLSDVWTMCEEFRTRAAGDPCAEDLDCVPGSVSGPGIDRHHLVCAASVCADAPDPAAPDWLSPCAAAAAFVVDGSDGIQVGELEDATCSRGVCFFSEKPTCIQSTCTLRCADDWDCPDDSTCGIFVDPTALDGGSAPAGVCMPADSAAVDCR